MKNKKKLSIVIGIIFILIIVIIPTVVLSTVLPNKRNVKIKYKTHVQDIGWQEWGYDGEKAGTEGQSKRLESIIITKGDQLGKNISINYQVHIQDIGWQSWKQNGEMAGTTGQSKRIEAIKICLENTEDYSIMYRVHIQDIGWQEWKFDGEIAGTEGQSKRLEAIEIKILKGKYEKFSINIEDNNNAINEYQKDNIYYLFIPKNMNITNLKLNYSGNVINTTYGDLDKTNKIITGDFSNIQNLTVTLNSGEEKNIKIIQSDITSIMINLKNDVSLKTINQGSKDTKYKATLNILGAEDEKYNISDNDIEFKGRGNFSWSLEKKGYQIKLSSKKNIMGMGKAKTWILIANHADATLMRNKLAYDLASEIGLDYTQESRWIDLWIDGEYQGNYLLTEKVQVESNRVNLEDDYGIIAELDNNYYASETTWFESNVSKSHFVLKDSVADDEDNIESKSVQAFNQFENYINTFESYLYSDNTNWEEISSMIDVESFVKYYFIQELSEDPDGARSSVFIYKDGENDIMHMGPVWDYDSAFGNYENENYGGNNKIDYINNIKKRMAISNNWYEKLFEIPEFREYAINIYNSEIKNIFNTSIQKINTYKVTINNSNILNFSRWNILGNDSLFDKKLGHKYKETFEKEVEYLSNWIAERINYLNERYSNTSKIINIDYKTHIQDYGWTKYNNQNGEISGTTGQSKRMEAITINLDTFNELLNEKISINYQTHIQDIGWQSWKKDGELAGTEGQSKRLEAIRIKLNDDSKYSVKYRVHVQDYGWMDWKYNGEIAGTTGESKRIEAIQIEIIQK